MMTYKKYFRISLFLPFVFPIISLALGSLLSPETNMNHLLAAQILNLPFTGITILFIPYIIFMVLVWKYINQWTLNKIIKLSIFAPFIFALVTFLLSLGFLYRLSGGEIYFQAPLIYSSIALGIGCFYIVLILIGFFLGRKLDWINE